MSNPYAITRAELEVPPGFPGTNPPNPFGGADPEAMLDYADLLRAQARRLQLRQQYPQPQYQPQPGAQMQPAVATQAAELPPQPQAASEQKPRASRKSAAAEEHGGSLWRYVVVFVVGVAVGGACNSRLHEVPPPSPQPQLSY